MGPGRWKEAALLYQIQWNLDRPVVVVRMIYEPIVWQQITGPD